MNPAIATHSSSLDREGSDFCLFLEGTERLSFPHIAYGGNRQRALQLGAAEVRMPPRSGKRTHIGQTAHTEPFEQRYELLERAVAVAYGVYG